MEKTHAAVKVVPHFLVNYFEEIRKLLLPFLSGLPGQRATRRSKLLPRSLSAG